MEKRRHRRARRGREEIRALVAEFKASGMPQVEFADLVGVNRTLLGRWIRREEEFSIPSVVPVRIKAEAGKLSTQSDIEIVTPSGVVVRVGAGFDGETLRRVIGTIESC